MAKSKQPVMKVLSKKEQRALEKKRQKRSKIKGAISYSSRKILRKRKSLLFKVGLIDSLSFILFFILFSAYKAFEYYLGDEVGFPKFDDKINLLIICSYLILVVLLISLIHFANYRKASRNFKEFYYDLLTEECQLEERTLFLNKEALSEAELRDIQDFLLIPDMLITTSYTLTSQVASFDITSISYNKKMNQGVILRVQTDKKHPQILQIRGDGKEGPAVFNKEKVEKYGIANAELNKDYALFTSMKSEVYRNLGHHIFKQLVTFKELVKGPFVVTFFNRDLVIFIDGWAIDLQRQLTDKDDIYYIDTQIEVLKLLENHLNAFAEIMEEKR